MLYYSNCYKRNSTEEIVLKEKSFQIKVTLLWKIEDIKIGEIITLLVLLLKTIAGVENLRLMKTKGFVKAGNNISTICRAKLITDPLYRKTAIGIENQELKKKKRCLWVGDNIFEICLAKMTVAALAQFVVLESTLMVIAKTIGVVNGVTNNVLVKDQLCKNIALRLGQLDLWLLTPTLVIIIMREEVIVKIPGVTIQEVVAIVEAERNRIGECLPMLTEEMVMKDVTVNAL